MDGVTPGTCHHEGGTSFVASMVMVCSFRWAGGGPLAKLVSIGMMASSPRSNPQRRKVRWCIDKACIMIVTVSW